MENGTYKQIVSHLERELKLNGLEAPDELQTNTVTQQAIQPNFGNPEPSCHDCKKPGHYRNQCRQLKREEDPARLVATIPTRTMVVVRQTLTAAMKFPTTPTRTKKTIREREKI